MTFLHQALTHAEECPDASAITFITPGSDPHTLTRAALLRRAGSVARQVRVETAPGDRVLVALPTSEELVVALVGVLMAGRVAVPAPAIPGPRNQARLEQITKDAGCTLAFSRQPVPEAVLPDVEGVPDLRIDPADIAVLQYTSGSTSLPKGVRVLTSSIDANLAAMERAFEQCATDVVAGWLPLFHDMGLVGTLLHPLRMGLHTVLMSPESFVRHPDAWLRAISDFGVTTSGGPDFGYSWCADLVKPAQLQGVDLSRWRVAFTGSEPISPRTMERFSRTFADSGFQPEAFTPCYGLAESTLLVSSAQVGALPRVSDLGVSCGRPMEDVVIVDSQGSQVEGTGEIWVRGPSVAQAYHGPSGNENFNLSTVDGRSDWLRTGDLGVLHDGELYVQGRAKDLVILRGENHHPHDLEMVANEVPGVLAACAFSSTGERERLVLALETRGAAAETVDLVRGEFRRTLAFEPDEVVIVRGRTLPRTTSGKLQRAACREAWEAGELRVAHRWTAGGERSPMTAREAELAGIWHELLGVRVESADASFFATGGASVLAVELAARIAERLDVHVSPVELLAAGTLKGQADVIARAPRAAASRPDPDEAPMSLQQEGLWLLAQLSPSGLPPVSITLDVPPGADVEGALAALVRRHPGLATAGPDAHGRQRLVPWTGAEGRPSMEEGVPFTALRGADQVELAWDHRVIDGWSVRVLVEEFDALLASRPLPPPPPSALAWATEQRKALAGSDDADDLAFWRDRPSSAAVDLPWGVPGATGAAVTSRRIADADALKRRARELNTTVAVLVLSAVAVVLGRQSGQDEVSVGVPFANRTPPWTRTVGCLVSVQRVLARLSDEITGEELVRQLTQELQDLRGRASVPLEALSARLGLSRAATQVDVVLDHLEVPARVGGLTIRGTSVELSPEQAKVPLTITAVEDEGMRLVLLRQRSFMDDEAAEEFAEQLELALRELVRAPQSPCLGWSLRTHRADIALPLSREELETPEVPLVPAMVMDVDPDRPAIQRGARTWTYGELHTRALDVAGTLQSAGVRPGDPVGILGSACFDTIAAALGTMLAGGVVLHLDRRLPTGRLAAMVREASTRVVVRAQGGDPRDAEIGTLVEIEAGAAGSAVAVAGGDPAYIVFSTGSTSTPKAIVGTHRGIAHFLTWQRREFEVGAEDRFVLLTNLAFDMALRDVWLPLISGGVLHLLDDPADVSGDNVLPLLVTQGTTRLHLVPTLARSWLTTTAATPLPALRSVFFAGEPLSDTVVTRFREHFRGDYEVLNFYGPSETTQTKIFFRVPEHPRPGVQPIGRPLPQTAVALLNAAGTPCGLGEPGEILLRTPFATDGYANQPAAQAERFVPDPLGSGQTAYRSGDLGRARLDGAIEILGRGDRQVKVHGVAVDPAEVADLLSSLPGVSQAAVRADPTADGDHVLVAWFVAERSWSSLREELADRLPSALVPERAMACPSLPVHPNGKVDVRALPAPADLAPTAAEPPKNSLEALVLEAWRTTLGLPELDMHADFFLHGGHSLKAIELASALKRVLGHDVPLMEVMQARTPRELARRCFATTERSDDTLPVLLHAPDDAYESFPMTPVQEAYWVGRRDFLELGGSAAQTYRELSCANDLDLLRLERAFQVLVERHPSLRTVATEDGRQIVLRDTPPFRVAVQDLRDDADPEAGVRAWRGDMAHRVRPLEQWPLIEVRASLLPNEIRLHVGLDAWVCDAWSRVLLIDELRELYNDPSRELAPLGLTFRDYVVSAEGTPKDTDLEWWRAELDSLPMAPRLPLARRTGTGFTRRNGRLDSAAWAAFQRHAGTSGVTASASLLAAFGWVLARWSAEDRFALNVTVFRRLPVHSDVGRLLGDFTSVLPHTMEARWENFARHARDVQARLWQELAHGSVSGVQLTRELARSTGRLNAVGLPVVFTSALTTPELGREFDWAWLGELVHGISQTPQVWLDLQVYEHRGELHYNWDAVEEMFEPGVLDALFEAWCAVLHTLVEEVWEEPAPELLPATQRLLQSRTNATGAPVVSDTLVDGVLAALARTPDALALIDADRTLTFAQLVEEAERVAAAILGQQVPRGALVAIVAPHGWRQAVAALGVLLAGAAYVPIDASQPMERIRQILAEAAPTCVLRAGDSWPDGVDLEDLPAVRRRRPPRAHDMAYVIYTSGSTGRPKGVVIRHEAAVNTLVDVADRMGFGAQDRALALSSLAFDLSVWDLFGTWRLGAAVVYPTDRNDPAAWARAAHAHGVRVWNSVPALAQMLADALEADPDLPAPGLRTFLLSGDWIPLRLPERLRAVAPEAVVWSLGGATEASIWSVAHLVGDVDESRASIPYGRPLANQTVAVLDEHRRPCPVHVPGRLFIGGLGLADAYWRDPVRTAERFVDHEGARLYDTGDLARWLPDGNLELLGRVDTQVKIRGYRVELGEIEHTLESLPGVERAAVVVVGDPRGDRRLVGFVVPRADAAAADADAVGTAVELSERELSRELSAKLPDHMVPHAWTVLTALPLSANGKIDRAALTARIQAAPAPAPVPDPSSSASPVPAEDNVLARAWAEVLGTPPAGPAANFFSAGGDSVTWLRVCAHVSRTGWRLPAAAIGQDASFAALSAHLSPPSAPVPVPEGPTPPAPMRTWLEFRGLPGRFNQGVLLRLLRPLDAEALDRALAAVVVAHPALASTLTGGFGGHVVEYGDDLETACRGFDADGALLRATVMPGHLLLCAHHVVVDAQSWKVIVGDVEEALDAFEAGGVPSLAPEATSYASWCHAVAGLPAPATLPSLPPPGETGRERNTFVTAQPLSARPQGVRAAIERLRCTEEELLVAAAAWANGSVTGRWDVEVERHGRMLGALDLGRTVGWLTALIPLVLDGGSPADVLLQVKERLRGLPDGGLALAAAYASSGRSSSLTVNPLGVLGDEASSRFALVRDAALPLRDPSLPRTNERRITLYTIGETLKGELNHREGADAWLKAFEAALEEFLEVPGSAAAGGIDFPASGLPDDEIRALLAGLETTDE